MYGEMASVWLLPIMHLRCGHPAAILPHYSHHHDWPSTCIEDESFVMNVAPMCRTAPRAATAVLGLPSATLSWAGATCACAELAHG